MFTKIFSLFFKTAILLVIGAVLYPIVYFGWHLTQPMNPPGFKGLTFIQFIQWRTAFLKNQAVKYQHMGYTITHGLNQCEDMDLTFNALEIPFSALPVLMIDMSDGWPNLLHFPQDWWKSYEDWTWSGAMSQEHNLPNVAFCNVRLDDIPTPAQLQSMQNAQQIMKLRIAP